MDEGLVATVNENSTSGTWPIGELLSRSVHADTVAGNLGIPQFRPCAPAAGFNHPSKCVVRGAFAAGATGWRTRSSSPFHLAELVPTVNVRYPIVRHVSVRIV